MTGITGGRRLRLRAPELVGRGGWLNTGGVTLSLADLRGRFVLIDFWCGCCVNCLHTLDELRPIEDRFADVLTVVAVHSPKFAHEREHSTVVAATERYGVTHPVLDDPELRTWDAYVARAWPTLVLVDPAGYIVDQYAGEGHGHTIAALLEEQVAGHEAAGTLHRGPSPVSTPPTSPTGLRFPGGAVLLPGGGLLVADTARHRLVELAADLVTEVTRIGSGLRGLADTAADSPIDTAADTAADTRAAGSVRFAEPQKLCLLPPAVAAAAGYDVLVADTANHALRGVRLSDGAVRTVAGTGSAWQPGDPEEVLSSPWDVVWWRDLAWVALAGTHQLATFDPLTGGCRRTGGTTAEGIRDGALAEAWFAQPSGLAVDAVRDRLWLVDAESSAVRYVDGPAAALRVTTVAGTGLFDFGHRDGPFGESLFQHPLGIAVEAGGTVLVADTYNGALRRLDPDAGTVRTLATGLAEPADVLVAGDRLIVVEAAGHRLTALDPGGESRLVDHEPQVVARRPTPIPPGPVRLRVAFTPPPGQHLDSRYADAVQVVVQSTPAALLRAGAGSGAELVRDLDIDAAAGDGILHVGVRVASCDDETAANPNPACRVHRQDWGIPVVVVADGPPVLELMFGGGT